MDISVDVRRIDDSNFLRASDLPLSQAPDSPRCNEQSHAEAAAEQDVGSHRK
ncbi:hypothetical protein PQQ52_04105 [Paraburkholderia sediminicola]|uniref:hypothetical protein n=1 Tax=Paraburkholderia sediminicola TaxID=458836 RepID=UPI0038B7B4E8